MMKKVKGFIKKIDISKLVNFKNINIGWKYGLIMIIIFILFGMSTLLVSKFVNDIGRSVDQLNTRGDIAIDVSELATLTESKGLRIANYVHYSDIDYVTEYEEKSTKFNELIDAITKELNKPEQLELLQQIVDNDARMNTMLADQIVPAVKGDDWVTAKRLALDGNNIQLENVVILDTIRDIVNNERSIAVQDVEETQKATVLVLIASIIATIIIGGVLYVLLSRMIVRNLNKVVEVSNYISDGDLTVPAIDYKGNDEIGRIAFAVNKMTFSLREMIAKISMISDNVKGKSNELSESSNEVRLASEQVAVIMQELATGSENQTSHVEGLSYKIDSFMEKVKVANVNGNHIVESTDQVKEMTNSGSQLMNMSIEQMEKIDKIVQDSVQKVQGLDDQSKEVTKLVAIIKDIADQTNLLALNAAIEAARAGEYGKGFAVVASEVRKLSRQVSNSVTEITNIVGRIQSETTVVTNYLQDGYSEVQQGATTIKSTGEKFGEITGAVDKTIVSIQTILQSLGEISSTSQQMNDSLEELSAISEESASGVEETSAATEQTSSSMEEVSISSNQLAELAEDLNNLVLQFKI